MELTGLAGLFGRQAKSRREGKATDCYPLLLVLPRDDWQGVRSCGRRRVAMLGHCLAAEKKAMTMQYWVSGTDRAVRVVWEAG